MVDDYWTRLKAEMDKKGWDISALADRLGVSYQAVNKVKNGGAFGSQNNIKAARLFGVSPEYLATGRSSESEAIELGFSESLDLPVFSRRVESSSPDLGGSKTATLRKVLDRLQRPNAQSNVEEAPVLKQNRLVPVVGEVKGGDDGFLEELQYPVGHGEGSVDYPTSDSLAYALRVRGDSMHPRYRAGEFIVVTPSIVAQPSDDVVVALKDGRKLLKVLNWIQDGEIQLLSVNNHFGPLTLQLAEVEFVHLVDGRVRRSAFHRA
jgi:phage repressor protein C with HTH and peptisase S24 domain